MKRILTLAFIASVFYSNAQTQGIAYTAVGRGVATTFVTDYHALGINAAALGWGNDYGKRFTTGTTEFSFGVYSDSLNVDRLRKLYKAIRSDVTGKDQDPGQWEQQKEYAKDYARSGVSLDASYNWLGFSYYGEKLGGIAFNISEQYNWYSRLNEETTELVFGGKLSSYFDSLTIAFNGDTSVIANSNNLSQDTMDHVILGSITTPLMLSQITEGSSIRLVWNRNYNFGYGRKLFGNDSTFALYAGVGGRFIQSMAMLSLESENGEVKMYSSLSPRYDIDYGSISLLNPSTYTQSGLIAKPVGYGYGIDLAASAKLFGMLKVGLAVNNIGQVKYTRNVYKINDSIVGSMSLNGLDNYNITNSLDQFLEDGGILSLEGQEEYVLKNAANVRIGASADIGELSTVGVDLIAPFDNSIPGSLNSYVISVGADFKPMKWLTVSVGYLGGGIYQYNVPVGINFVLGGGTYEFGISSRDALSFFMNNSNSISTAFGVARVRF